MKGDAWDMGNVLSAVIIMEVYDLHAVLFERHVGQVRCKYRDIASVDFCCNSSCACPLF